MLDVLIQEPALLNVPMQRGINKIHYLKTRKKNLFTETKLYLYVSGTSSLQ